MVKDDYGKLWEIEYKSGTATSDAQQRFIDRRAQVSEDQNLELLACETAECVTHHIEIIADAEEIAEAFARTTQGHELISHHQNSGAYIAKYVEARGPRSLLTPYEKFQASSCGSVSDAECESMYQRKIEREFGIFMFLLTGAVPPFAVAEGVASCVSSDFSVGTCVMAAIDAATPGRIPSVRIAPNRTQLIDDLVAGGTRITPENVVDIRSINGRTVWLETGNSSAGLQHIVGQHGPEFAQRGITEAQIPDVVFTALQRNNVVGYQGRGTGRPIYEFEYGGQTHQLAITVGDNGFIVGASFR